MPTQYEIIKEKITSLQDALLTQHPTFPHLLRDIHQQLKQDPSNVTLLAEEDIQIIVSGLQRQTQTTLIAAVSKSSGTKVAKAAIKGITADDLF